MKEQVPPKLQVVFFASNFRSCIFAPKFFSIEKTTCTNI